MDTVSHHWNGRWGRLARRDVWLKTDGRLWTVEARKGDSDSRVWSRTFTEETAARALVGEILARGDEWRDLVLISCPPAPAPATEAPSAPGG